MTKKAKPLPEDPRPENTSRLVWLEPIGWLTLTT